MFDTLKAAAQAQARYRTANLPAPVRGLIRNENIAMSKPAGALVLENWFPTSTGIVTRRGKRKHATLSGSSAVSALMTYVFGASTKLFAADNSGIYDATTPASPTTPLTAVSGTGTTTSGNFSSVQFSTSGGEFLVCVNGQNLHKVFNGTTWAENSPAITGVTSDNFNHVWSFKNRLFFIRKNSRKFGYLPVNSIGGAITEFDLGPVLTLGGTLVMGGTWSSDAGNDIQDFCVFVSSEGEVAVYNGTDPSNASTWALQGVYRIGKPLGRRAMFKAGGDLGIATREGLVPISAAYSQAVEALSDVAISKDIGPLWTDLAANRSSVDWQVQPFTNVHSMLWIAPPTITGQEPLVLVANMRTGAWCVFTGYNVRSMAAVGTALYAGDAVGVIYEAETGGTDDGWTYTARAAGLWDELKAPLQQKSVSMIRGTFRANLPTFTPQWSVSTDYDTSFQSAPSAGANTSTALWGSAVWGSATWGGGNIEYRKSEWAMVAGVGQMISWQLQVTLGNTVTPDIELASAGLVYEVGETVA
jgi:hypothetical protein